MPGDLSGVPAPSRPSDPVRATCPPFDFCTLERRRGDLLGRLSDAADGLAWPVLTTLTSLLPGCLRRLIRSDSSPHTEADPIG